MTAKEKAWDLMHKMNGMKIKTREWQMCSDYARRDLKRKAFIVVEEILLLHCLTDEAWLNVPDEYKSQYWREVKSEIEIL